MHNFIEGPICAGKERTKDPVHPTQKPLRVLRQLVEWGSNPGDLVLDPFMGVGSTGVAAVELGRRFVGIELEEAYVAAARRRIEAAEGAAHAPVADRLRAELRATRAHDGPSRGLRESYRRARAVAD